MRQTLPGMVKIIHSIAMFLSTINELLDDGGREFAAKAMLTRFAGVY
jgi:hypothetical protein